MIRHNLSPSVHLFVHPYVNLSICTFLLKYGILWEGHRSFSHMPSNLKKKMIRRNASSLPEALFSLSALLQSIFYQCRTKTGIHSIYGFEMRTSTNCHNPCLIAVELQQLILSTDKIILWIQFPIQDSNLRKYQVSNFGPF